MAIPLEVCAMVVGSMATACVILYRDGQKARADMVALLLKINNLRDGD